MPLPWVRQELNERTFARLILAGVIFGFLAVGVMATVAIWAVTQNQRYSAAVNHTYRVARDISEFRMLSERAETGRRGIMLTGQERFFNVYAESAADMDALLKRIDQLTKDNPSQQKRIARLRELTALQLSLFSTALDQVRRGERAQAIEEFGINSSPEVMFAIRTLTQEMNAEEDRLLRLRNAERDDSGRIVFLTLSVTALLMVLLGLSSTWVIMRYTHDLTASRARLRAVNEGLEQAVEVRTADLSRANDEIQRFAYIVSHDLRSPLVNVMGFTSELEAAAVPLHALVERVQAEAPELVTPEARAAVAEDLPEAIGFIRSSTQKMDRLINAILRLSREGRRVLTPEPLDMEAVIGGVLDSVRHRASETGVELILERPLPPLHNDRLAIEQVFSNLVENAVKYTKAGSGGRVTVRGRAELGRLTYEVEDEGRGIDPKDHERIFELFRRSGLQDQPGEGIGLAHVRALVYRLGGFITCDSALDRGATFRVSLPPSVKSDPREAS